MGKKKEKQVVHVVEQQREADPPFELKFRLALNEGQIDKVIDLIWKVVRAQGLSVGASDVRAIAADYLD